MWTTCHSTVRVTQRCIWILVFAVEKEGSRWRRHQNCYNDANDAIVGQCGKGWIPLKTSSKLLQRRHCWPVWKRKDPVEDVIKTVTTTPLLASVEKEGSRWRRHRNCYNDAIVGQCGKGRIPLKTSSKLLQRRQRRHCWPVRKRMDPVEDVIKTVTTTPLLASVEKDGSRWRRHQNCYHDGIVGQCGKHLSIMLIQTRLACFPNWTRSRIRLQYAETIFVLCCVLVT